ncbi:hypothetical protein COL922a_012359 [Colletotrichum nupharicola]|nr:hypothetical protein COL922a_012359 [Colletotrichum nupharicola]
MAIMQFFTSAPGFVDGKEINKADREITEMVRETAHQTVKSLLSSPARSQLQSQSPLSPSEHDQTKSIGETPRLDTPENLQADLEYLCLLQTSAPSSSFPPSASFHLGPDALGRLELLLARIRVARFSYDFVTQSAYIMMVETTIYSQCNRAIGILLESAIEQLADAVTAAAVAATPATAYGPQLGHDNDDGTENQNEQNEQNESLHILSRRLRQVWSDNAVRIVVPNKLKTDPDNQFIDDGAASPIPPFVVEISYSQSLKDAMNKAELYVEHTNAHIRTVLILDVQYPNISSIRVHLFATEMTAAGRPVLHEVQSLTLFDFADAIAAAEQDHDAAAGIASPNPGPLRLFASDFLSVDSHVPARLKRPIPFEGHGDEIVQVEIPFESLRDTCLRARELHLKKQEKAQNFW